MRTIIKQILLLSGLILPAINEAYANNSIYLGDDYYYQRDTTIKLLSTIENVKIESIQAININDIKKIIENNNLRVKAEKLKIDQAGNLLQSKIALWYPTLNLSGNGLPQYLYGNTYNNSDFASDVSSEQWKASISAELKWDIINPARVPEISSARDDFEKAKFSYTIKLRDITLEAKKIYYELQKANAEVEIAKDSLEFSKLNLNDTKKKLEAGTGTKLEVLEAETQLAKDKQLLTNNLSKKRIKQRSLAKILNLKPTITPTASQKPEKYGEWEITLENSILAGYKFRKELNNIKLDISINNNKANSAIAASQPKISLVNTLTQNYSQGQISVNSPNMKNYSSGLSNTIGINASWLLFDGNKSRSLYKYNRNKAKEAKANFDLKKLEIREDIEENYYNLKTAEENISTSLKGVNSAKESLRLARLRYESGIAAQREVINNQSDLTDAKVNHVIAITDYNIYLSNLMRKTGLNVWKNCDLSKHKYSNLAIDHYGKSLEGQDSMIKAYCLK